MINLDSVTKEYSIGLSNYSLFYRFFKKKITFNKILALSNINFRYPTRRSVRNYSVVMERVNQLYYKLFVEPFLLHLESLKLMVKSEHF